ncbi:DarT ssDNA thymidine ADP-ribosyltransferase family protein [Aeromonas enteropelogenes]|uniref:DarT ssDNA thymidine ADP-ribosyltransferase family protein n=1 Tax=Aeromonas enteropelogenes TaxID=29489 RepID=UPI003B9F520D
MSIKDKKQIYHLTALSNLESILEHGLLPRNRVRGFTDVADAEIIEKRQRLGLNSKVPFHFFAKNPFDGRVLAEHPDEQFVLIAVHRTLAEAQNWWIVDKHPLANDVVVYSDYQEGFEAINWELMDLRDYRSRECKQVCMAECVAPDTVPVSDFASFYVKDEATQAIVRDMLAARNITKHVNINSAML